MNLTVTKKRILALVLTALMMISTGFSGALSKVYAEEINDYAVASSTDAAQENEASEVLLSDLQVNFSVVEEARFDTPFENKYIVVDMGDGSTQFESAEVVLLNQTTGERYTFEADKIVDTSMLFYISFADESFSGKYVIEKVIYTAGGYSYEKLMSDEDIAPAFGVNTDIDEDPTGWLSVEPVTETDPELDKYITDYSDSFQNAKVIGAGLGKNSASSDSHVFSTAPENVVVVLDPGHGGSDPGACSTWNGVLYCERDINQTIADACYEELKKYSNVTVYMTRTSASEPLHGTVGQDLQWRCDYSHEVSADLFVSFHCNSSGTPNSRKGAEVYIPNSSYNYIGAIQEGMALASIRTNDNDELWGFINTKGEVVVPFKYHAENANGSDYIYYYNNGFGRLLDKRTGKLLIFNKKGEQVKPTPSHSRKKSSKKKRR